MSGLNSPSLSAQAGRIRISDFDPVKSYTDIVRSWFGVRIFLRLSQMATAMSRTVRLQACDIGAVQDIVVEQVTNPPVSRVERGYIRLQASNARARCHAPA
jgi:hypothetical protein